MNNDPKIMKLPAKSPIKSIKLSDSLVIGEKRMIMMAGPCAVESYEQTHAAAKAVSQAGVKVLRGGAYKPRTSPFSFDGLGLEGLKILRDVADQFQLLVVTEAMTESQLPDILDRADIVQIGSRNMQNFPLLWAVGETDKPILLKRGFMATIEEWLMAAEHIANRGNENIILCERGIRSFDSSTRNVLDTTAIALVKQLSPFPVIADPSHATGNTELVLPAARAAVAAGADGLLVEVHPSPGEALSDGQQSLRTSQFADFFEEVEKIAGAVGRSFAQIIK